MISGPYGNGHRIDLKALLLAKEEKACLDQWFFEVNAPRQSYWLLSVSSSAHFQGIGKPIKLYPEATHAIFIVALDPRSDPNPIDTSTWVPIHDFSYFYHLHNMNDQDALELGDWIMAGIVMGDPPIGGTPSPLARLSSRIDFWRENRELCRLQATT